MLRSIEAKDYMSVNPVTFQVHTNIFDAIHELLTRRISGATVVDENKKVVGVISEMDCLKAIINLGYYDEGEGLVGDFMTASVDTIDKEINIVDAAQLLLKTNRRRMPVIEDGKFSGQISARSILQAFKDSRLAHDKVEDTAYE